LIGDQAIGFRRDAGDRYEILDLGAEWKRLTDQPFVYALWLIRPDFPQQREVAAALRSLGKRNIARLETVITAQPEAEREFCDFYFRHCLRFTFGEREKKGFRLFSEQCLKQDLLARVPPPPTLL
jgi:chorismate dehydratase